MLFFCQPGNRYSDEMYVGYMSFLFDEICPNKIRVSDDKCQLQRVFISEEEENMKNPVSQNANKVNVPRKSR